MKCACFELSVNGTLCILMVFLFMDKAGPHFSKLCVLILKDNCGLRLHGKNNEATMILVYFLFSWPYNLLQAIHSHEALKVVNPSSMQDAYQPFNSQQ